MLKSIPPHDDTSAMAVARRLPMHLAAGPWFDPIALFALRRWIFPLSRLWAATNQADGNVDAFFAAVPIKGGTRDHGRVRAALLQTDQARLLAEAADTQWQDLFFSGTGISNRQRLVAARTRHAQRHDYYASRRHFRFLRDHDTPLVNQIIEPPATAAERFDDLAAGKNVLAPLPHAMPKIEVSQPLDTTHVTEHWLRFASPSPATQDIVTAHVYAPRDITNPPTLIFGHGICVENDHWQGLFDEVGNLVANGIRVIRPEAPWHGYRTPPGKYGGEPLIEVFPSALIDGMAAAIQEWAVLADWARQTSNGPLAFGGTSLGALTAQRAAEESRLWPQRLRPDALLLVTHSCNILETIMEGDLTRLWSNPEKARAAGWDVATAAKYLDVLNPGIYPPIPANRIVSVLGSRDRVTPYASGKTLLDRWAVPDKNRFIWWRGHFSIPATLMHDPAPVLRFSEIVNRL